MFLRSGTVSRLQIESKGLGVRCWFQRSKLVLRGQILGGRRPMEGPNDQREENTRIT